MRVSLPNSLQSPKGDCPFCGYPGSDYPRNGKSIVKLLRPVWMYTAPCTRGVSNDILSGEHHANDRKPQLESINRAYSEDIGTIKGGYRDLIDTLESPWTSLDTPEFIMHTSQSEWSNHD